VTVYEDMDDSGPAMDQTEWWNVFDDDGFSQIIAHLAAPISGSLSWLRVRELSRLDGLRAAHTVRHPCIH
jgi:hypothetical protein